jgi:hypothetical protein
MLSVSVIENKNLKFICHLFFLVMEIYKNFGGNKCLTKKYLPLSAENS